MVALKKEYITKEGLDKVVSELERLKLIERPKVISALKEARALGDLSENAEYDSARTEQAILESKIQELESMVENAVIVSDQPSDKVAIASKVVIKYVLDNELETYTIVGSAEADPFQNKISYESPIAKAIMNKKAGAVVTVESPNGKYDIEIMEIK